MLTYNAMIKEFNKSLIENKVLQRLQIVRSYKFELEQLILEREFFDPNFSKLRSIIIQGKEEELFMELIAEQDKIRRMLKIIERKINEKGWHQKDSRLAAILSLALKENETAYKLTVLFKKEKRALEKENYMKFLLLLKEEKEILLPLADYAQSIGLQFVQSQIYSIGKKESFSETYTVETALLVGLLGITLTFLLTKDNEINLNFSSFAQDLFKNNGAQIVSQIATYFGYCISSAFTATGLLTKGVQCINLFSGKISDMKGKLRKGNALIINTPPKKAIDMVKELQEKYNIKIKGKYVLSDIRVLKDCLSIYYPYELKGVLKTIKFVARLWSKYGQYQSKAKKILILTGTDKIILDHELAHARFNNAPYSFYQNWLKVNRISYYNARQLRKNKEKPIRKKTKKSLGEWAKLHYKKGLGYGYARAYGSMDMGEDYATMTELVFLCGRTKNSRYNYLDKSIRNKEFIIPYLDVYKKKARLLLQYRYITQQDYYLFLQHMNTHYGGEEQKIWSIEKNAA